MTSCFGSLLSCISDSSSKKADGDEPLPDVYAPSIKPVPDFDSKKDAAILREAMHGIGTNEVAMINVLCKRTWQQRAEIEAAYRQVYNKDLETKIIGETSGAFQRVLLRLLKTNYELIAFELNEALKGQGVDKQGILEIVYTATNAEMEKIKEKYQQMYNRSLNEDMAGAGDAVLSGPFKGVLSKLLTTNRPEAAKKSGGIGADIESATKDAQRMFNDLDKMVSAGNKLATGDASGGIIDILTTRSVDQLNVIFDKFAKDYKMPIATLVNSKLGGTVIDHLMKISQPHVTIKNKQEYFAERLNAALRNNNDAARDAMLVRIIVWRADIDLEAIKEVYLKKYGRPLAFDVMDEVSGDYEDSLVALIGD